MVGGSYCNSMTKVSCLPEKAMPRTTNSPKAMSLALLQPVLQKERNLVVYVYVVDVVVVLVFRVGVTGIAIVDVLIAAVLILNTVVIVSVVVDVVDVVGGEQGLCPETASSLANVLPASVAFFWYSFCRLYWIRLYYTLWYFSCKSRSCSPSYCCT